ncbi:MAG TPA: hypothetical protein VFO10_11015 [Oligoflexus sp.]|uniref:hypothetical protein n=1 Tax=Oligoflexus sp. TaxID=1971216 RepID=UPI002D7E6D0F|nr:hypothetical protein [Oligoflexus sp.]HET9237774.1 hypothetical protein [Oligoflexus sp.]
MQPLITRFILLMGLSFGLCPAYAEVFPLRMGVLGQQPGTLEMARDPNFQSVLVTLKLGEKSEYLVNFPDTAVYYVRVRQQEKILWQEAVLALLDGTQDQQLARLDWSPVPQVKRYRLWVSRHTVRTRWLETDELGARLHKIGAPWLIRVRGLTNQGRYVPVTDLRFRWEALGIAGAAKEQPKVPDVALDVTAPDDDQVVYEPEDKDLLSGPEDGLMASWVGRSSAPDLPPLQRKHEAYVWLRYLREDFSIDKKDRFEAEPSTGLGSGGGGQYFLAPNFSISGTLDTHATRTDYEAGGAQAPNTEQKRIRFHVALGLDLLNTHVRTTDWSLMLGPVAGLVQMPLQQNDQKFTDYGIHLASQHYPSRLAFALLFLKSGSREIHGRWIAPLTVWSMQPFLGLYLYNTRQSAGAVTGRFQESGLRFGLARDF